MAAPPLFDLIPIGDRKFLGRKEGDHAAALVGDDDFLLDTRRRVAVLGWAIGFERKHHAFLDLGRVIHRDHARDDRPLVDRAADAVAELQAERRELVREAELLSLRPYARDL